MNYGLREAGLSLTFLGAAGTVTGSKYLLQADKHRVLVDCGLFQGVKQLRLRNWAPLPVDPTSIDAVVLTHAHIDHSGYLPVLVRHGFRGPVHCSEATKDLCEILLPDSGFLQEKDAERANRYGYTKHTPALPLYKRAEAEACLKLLLTHPFDEPIRIGPDLTVRFRRAGHILGSATLEFDCRGTVVAFSGDLGRMSDPLMAPPEPIARADYLVVESTYGNREHDSADPADVLARIITETARRGGTVLVPTFAVGRAQSLLYQLYRLRQDKRIPDVPMFLDSPMAVDASELLCKHPPEHRLPQDVCRVMCREVRYVNSVEESKALGANVAPKVILAASGMATGGRVLHHLKTFGPDPRSTILFAGFQAAGTRGAALVGGASAVKIHGAYVPIRAEVQNLATLSAHADRSEILSWLSRFTSPPRVTFVTHGEPTASDALRVAIEERLHWTVKVPEQGEMSELWFAAVSRTPGHQSRGA